MNAAIDSPEVHLDAVRAAWRMYCAAEATINRLSAYEYPSRIMRSDLQQARGRRELARADLTRLLRDPTLSPASEPGIPEAFSVTRSGGSFNHPATETGD